MGALRVIDKEGLWVKELEYETSVLTMMQMKDCQTSPKLEKQTERGDDDPCEHPELCRSVVYTILHMTKRRPDLLAECVRGSGIPTKSQVAVGQNSELHQGFERLGCIHAEGRQIPLRLSSMETGLPMTWTESQHLEGI